MAAKSATIVDLKTYREARWRAAAPAPADVPAQRTLPVQAVAVWVPVWSFVPMAAGPWFHGRS